MFSIQMERSRSDSSTSSICSALSLSPCGWTPRAAALSPATTTTTPLNGSPEMQSSKSRNWQQHQHPMKRSVTAPNPISLETFCPSSGRGAFGYPCWPAGESLSAGSSPRAPGSSPTSSPISPTSSAYYMSFQPPTSHISDDDLEQLDFSSQPASQSPSLEVVEEVPTGGPGACDGGISWSQVGALAAQQEQQPQQPQLRRRLPPPPPGMAMGDTRRRKRGPSRSTSRGNTTRRCTGPSAA